MITRRVAEALAEQEANRNLGTIVESESENGDDNKNGNGGGRRNGNEGRGNGNGNQGGNASGAGIASLMQDDVTPSNINLLYFFSWTYVGLGNNMGWPAPLSGLRAGPIRSEGTIGLVFSCSFYCMLGDLSRLCLDFEY
ncbi:hypothetical protein Tco_1146695 [Tanacetum coccineum]